MADPVVLIAWDAGSDRVLVGADGTSLPTLQLDNARYGAEAPAAARRELGLDGFLLAHVPTRPDVGVIVPTAGRTPDGFVWVTGNSAAERVHYPPARDWLRQRHQPLRPWFAPDWYDAAVRYATEVIDDLGGQLTAKPYQVRHWPLSSVILLPTSIGNFYLKTVPEADVYEPDLLALAYQLDIPGLPPEPVAHNRDLYGWLAPEYRGRDAASMTEPQSLPAIRGFAQLQQASMADIDALAALGLQRRSLETTADRVAELIGRDDLWSAQPEPYERWRGLTDHQRQTWTERGPWLADCCHRLAGLAQRTGIEWALTHGDLHTGNATVQLDGQVAIHDWGEATIAHPFVDLGTWIYHMTEDGARLHVANYLAAWRDHAAPNDIAEMWRLAKPVSAVVGLDQTVRKVDEYGPVDRHAVIAIAYGWVRRIVGAAADPDAMISNWPITP